MTQAASIVLHPSSVWSGAASSTQSGLRMLDWQLKNRTLRTGRVLWFIFRLSITCNLHHCVTTWSSCMPQMRYTSNEQLVQFFARYLRKCEQRHRRLWRVCVASWRRDTGAWRHQLSELLLSLKKVNGLLHSATLIIAKSVDTDTIVHPLLQHSQFTNSKQHHGAVFAHDYVSHFVLIIT
jgi:hypothetical protein